MIPPPPAMRSSVREPTEDDGHAIDWTLALAGGEGVRLSDYVTRRFGARIPKQYCRMIGDRSMLEHTLDRLNQITPAARTMTVIGTDHQTWAGAQLAGRSDHVFCQPSSRDTGVALYVALAMIKRWHPNAIVTITPTDHYVAPAARYVETIALARGIATKLRDLVVLLGVEPSEPDSDLGYIVPGPPHAEIRHVASVAKFVEKPDLGYATELARGGALWSTMVACGSVGALWELGRAAEPRLLDILDSLVPLIGTPEESEAIEYIYRAYIPVSFSRDICERAASRIATMPIAGIEWCDFGKSDRIERVLARRDREAPQEMRA